MKKLIYLIVAIVILGLIASGCLPVVPLAEKDETSSLTKAKPLKPPSGAHYNLNIIGKKADWSGQGSYSNPNRHTMFVPENTDEFMLDGSHCYAPAPLPEGEEVSVDRPGITIWMTQCGEECDDFAVLDGNAFDDCKCEFRLARGRYDVYIVAKAKPPKLGENYYTDITGWVMGYDPIDKEDYFYFSIGTVNVKKKEGWQDATHIFEVDASEDPFVGEWLSITYPVCGYSNI